MSQVYIDPNSLNVPPSVRQHIPMLTQTLVNDIINKRDSHPARTEIYNICCNNPAQNPEFIRLLTNAAMIAGLFIDYQNMPPVNAVHAGVAKTMDVKTSVLYRDSPHMTQGLPGNIINSIQNTLNELPRLEQALAAYTQELANRGMIGSNISGFGQNQNFGNNGFNNPGSGLTNPFMSNNGFGRQNNIPATGGMGGMFSAPPVNNSAFNTSFNNQPARTEPFTTGFGAQGVAMFQQHTEPTAPTARPVVARNSNTTESNGNTRKKRVYAKATMVDGEITNDASSSNIDDFLPQAGTHSVAKNAFSDIHPKPNQVQYKQSIADSVLDLEEVHKPLARTFSVDLPYAIVYNPNYYSMELIISNGVVKEQISTEEGIPIDFSEDGDPTALMSYADEEIDPANRAWLAESQPKEEGSELRVSVYRGVGKRVYKTAESETPVTAEITADTPSNEIVFSVDTHLDTVYSPSITEARADVLIKASEAGTVLPDAYTFTHVNRSAYQIKGILPSVIEDLQCCFTLDGFHEIFGLLRQSMSDTTFDRLNRLMTENINAALSHKMGIRDIQIHDFDAEYIELLGRLREFDTTVYQTFSRHSAEIVTKFKGNSEFIIDKKTEGSDIVTGFMRWNWTTLIVRLPISAAELSLGCNEKSGMIHPSINPHTYAIMTKIMERAGNTNKASVKLITSDDEVIDLMRGYFNPDALILKFNN